MGRTSNRFAIVQVLVGAVWVVTACGPLPTAGPFTAPTTVPAPIAAQSSAAAVAPAAVAEQRDPNVPALPFPDHPDPMVGLNPPQEGWVPAPFVQFEPVRQP